MAMRPQLSRNFPTFMDGQGRMAMRPYDRRRAESDFNSMDLTLRRRAFAISLILELKILSISTKNEAKGISRFIFCGME